MEKELLSNFKEKTKIYSGEGSTIYRLPDKRILKVASQIVLDTCEALDINYEQKILDTRAQRVKEINSPLTAVYHNGICNSYTMEEVMGKTLNNYDENFTLQQRGDLGHYYYLYKKIEDVIKKANSVGIVMPDICTCDNIIIMPDGNLKFIDYDGMQFGEKDKSITMSTSLGNPRKYFASSKFCTVPFHFTTELDKTSLTILMFLVVFNIDLNKVNTRNPFTGEIITLKDIFDMLGIKDEIFINKVAANISSDKSGVYLQDELYKIMTNYKMLAFPIPGIENGTYIKKLKLK